MYVCTSPCSLDALVSYGCKIYVQAVIPLSLPDALVRYNRMYAISPCPLSKPSTGGLPRVDMLMWMLSQVIVGVLGIAGEGKLQEMMKSMG